MKPFLRWSAQATFKVLAFYSLSYVGLFLGAAFFKNSVHLLSGISPEDMDIQNYRTPDPAPSQNFFTALDYDFSPSNNVFPYSPKGLHDYEPIPGICGKEKFGYGVWPWLPDFLYYFDLDSTATELLGHARTTDPKLRPDMTSHRQFILSSKTAYQTCERSITVFRPFFKRLYAGLSMTESLNPYPYPKTLVSDTRSLGVIDLIRLARLLALESVLHLAQNSEINALSPVFVNLRIAQGLLDRPVFLMNHVAGQAVTRITLPVIWKGLDGPRLKKEDLIKIDKYLSTIDPLKNVMTTVAQEACFNYWAIRNNANSIHLSFPSKLLLSPVTRPISVNFFQGLVVLDLWRFRMATTGQKAFLEKFFFSNPEAFLTRSVDFYNNAILTDVQLQLTRLDLALQIYRSQTGVLPDSLEQLFPVVCKALPIDPFSREPYKYKKSGPDSYTIYSCWVDGKDDGGIPVDISMIKPKDIQKFVLQDVKGDFVWPQHTAKYK